MVTCLAFLPLVMARTLESTFDLQIPGAVLVIAGVIMVLFGIPAVILLRLYLRRRAREEAAGYTLVSRRRLDLPQVEPRSGIVIRAENEQHPTISEIRRRYAEVRGGA